MVQDNNLDKILVFSFVFYMIGSLISCSAQENTKEEINESKVINELEIDSVHEKHVEDSIKKTVDQIDSVKREFNPLHPKLHWTSIKVLPTKGTILDDSGKTVWIQYFENGQLLIDKSQFKKGRYTIFISDTSRKILSEQFICR